MTSALGGGGTKHHQFRFSGDRAGSGPIQGPTKTKMQKSGRNTELTKSTGVQSVVMELRR